MTTRSHDFFIIRHKYLLYCILFILDLYLFIKMIDFNSIDIILKEKIEDAAGAVCCCRVAGATERLRFARLCLSELCDEIIPIDSQSSFIVNDSVDGEAAALQGA